MAELPGEKIPTATGSPERASRARQRQRLIDACISALHIHGPSRTTVEKVVAIADMSPGIVRFYFDSKDAMLVASLAHLAAEFEERVMQPVALLRQTPVRALELLVDLYLDPDIASPRKVSVWYSFWGEASSRKEYYQICGKKDDDFAALVLDLVERLIAQSGLTHLDPDAISLGLIGVLEVHWQSFAFTDEAEIDRVAARRRTLAYLRSVFPQHFGSTAAEPRSVANVPSWAFTDPTLLTQERERLLRPSWQLAGHESQVRKPGDFLAVELAADRVLIVRASEGHLRAFRNSCRRRPHALVMERQGHTSILECPVHGLSYGLDGRARGDVAGGDLTELQLVTRGHLILVRAMPESSVLVSFDAGNPNVSAADVLPSDVWEGLTDLPLSLCEDTDVRADWKLLVEQWLEPLPRARDVQRTFVAPNQLVEAGARSLLVLQVLPQSVAHCRLRRFEFGAPGGVKAQAPGWIRQDIEVAQSTQAGLAAGAADADESAPESPELAEFRRSIAALLPGLPSGQRP